MKERIDLLESEIISQPPRFIIHQDLPFAILRFSPDEEWELRRQAKLLATRLSDHGKHVHEISMAELLWEAISETEGLEAIAELEREHGFAAAQEQVTTYLSDPDWHPLTTMITERTSRLDPRKDLVFLTRAAAMAPFIYYMSRLLDQMKGKTEVPAVLFYPGSIEGTTGLRFMDMSMKEAPLGNYRVKIYG